MTALLLFTLLIVGLNLIPRLPFVNFPKTAEVITKLVSWIALAFLILTLLSFNGYRLKGIHSNASVSIVFMCLCILYYAIVKYSRHKLIGIVFSIPLLVLSISTLLFNQTIYENKIDNSHYKIRVNTPGLLACGEGIYLTKTSLLVFDEEVLNEWNLCLRGIERIETVSFGKHSAEFLIYHNTELDSENPFRYKIDNIP
jgi:hypothetical protein